MATPPTPARAPDPLRNNVSIVNADGTPTPFFIRQWLQQRGVNDVSDDVIASVSELLNLTITAGTGLSGGGVLGDGDISLSLNAVLNDLLDVDVATDPPDDGQVLSFDEADSLWKPKTVTGGDSVFLGARAQIAVPFNPPAGLFTAIPWTNTSVDAGGFWDVGAPTRLTIPSGVTVVSLSAGAASIGPVSGQWILEIRDKTGAIVARSETDTVGGDAITTTSGPVPVASGDFFEAYINPQQARPIDAIPTSYFGVYAIAGPRSAFSNAKILTRVSLGF